MAKNLRWVTTRNQAIEEFKQTELPFVEIKYEQDGIPDLIARREAWHDFVNWLHENQEISDWQANNWTIPDCCG